MKSHIGIIDWGILILYGLMLIGIGWYYSSRQKSKDDFFLGGRSVSSFLSGVSLYVAFLVLFLIWPSQERLFNMVRCLL